ncbi:MAG: hypothetical protein KC613_28330, partial [Myxococcales bacterium]|nr:hypothetical protein [Myxococcales bacterium]
EAHALAQRLAALPAHDDAHLEALRLWLIHGHGAAAQALLTRVGHALCERGLAGDAFRLLEAAPAALAAHAELADWHRWCAREWGDPAAAWGLLEPGGHTLQQLDIHRLRLWTAFARGPHRRRGGRRRRHAAAATAGRGGRVLRPGPPGAA